MIIVNIGGTSVERKKLSKFAVIAAVLLCIVFVGTLTGMYPSAAATADTVTVKGTMYHLISSEEQLRAIGTTDEYPMDGSYLQNGDIELSAGEWVPIGTWEHPFTGTYNGNGFEIKGLTMTDPNANIIGMFGVAKEAHIYNGTLRDYDIMRAGRNLSSGKSVSAVLVFGQGSRSYDNSLYPKE